MRTNLTVETTDEQRRRIHEYLHPNERRREATRKEVAAWIGDLIDSLTRNKVYTAKKKPRPEGVCASCGHDADVHMGGDSLSLGTRCAHVSNDGPCYCRAFRKGE